MKKYLFLFSIFCSTLTFSQALKVNSIVQENNLVGFTNQKLILLDFWATWCGPCIPATQQLEVFQTENADKVFIVSISDENEATITKFLQRKPINLMVVSDYQSNTFEKYKVTKRPYAVLLNTAGELQWEGHPSDLTTAKLQNFVRKNAKVPAGKWSSFMEQMHDDGKAEEEIEKFTIQTVVDNDFEDFFSKGNKTFHFRGYISDLLVELLEVPKASVVAEFENFKVDFKTNAKYYADNKSKIISEIKKQFNLDIDKNREKVMAKELVVVDASRLWAPDYFQWSDDGTKTSNYIVGDDNIQADNLNLEQLAELLSNVRKEIYVYNGKDEAKYDWELQFKFDDLFTEALRENFGVEIQELSKKIPQIVITQEK